MASKKLLLSVLWGACSLLPTSAWGQCWIDAQVTKTAMRQDGNHMGSWVTAWASNGDWWNWYATAYGEMWFTPTGGAQSRVANGSKAGYLWSAGDYRNPTWYASELLEPRGNGSYFTRGWAAFVSACGTGGTIPPFDSPSQPVQRPVITMANAVFFLGTGVLSNNALSAQTTFSVDRKGATETPVWSVSSGGDKLQLSCASCLQPTGTAIGRSGQCNEMDVRVKASVNGFSSEEYLVFIDGPHWMVQISRGDYPYGEGLIGYTSQISYKVLGLCNDRMYLSMNESWTNWGRDYPSGTWPLPVPEDSWPFFDFDAIYAAGTPGYWVPDPMEPVIGNNCDPEVSLTEKVEWHTQEFRAGSTQKGSGVLVQRDKAQWYRDHGCHLTIQSPVL